MYMHLQVHVHVHVHVSHHSCHPLTISVCMGTYPRCTCTCKPYGSCFADALGVCLPRRKRLPGTPLCTCTLYMYVQLMAYRGTLIYSVCRNNEYFLLQEIPKLSTIIAVYMYMYITYCPKSKPLQI
jgi:hypothetical protein